LVFAARLWLVLDTFEDCHPTPWWPYRKSARDSINRFRPGRCLPGRNFRLGHNRTGTSRILSSPYAAVQEDPGNGQCPVRRLWLGTRKCTQFRFRLPSGI